MRISLPRRYRRKLLLPPGLLALAGLLWLGCVQIANDARLKKYSVLQLTVPSLCGLWDVDGSLINFYISPPELAAMRQWQTFHLTGTASIDSIAVHQIIQRMPSLCNAPDSISGIKVLFDKQSKYADFIRLLDAARASKVRRYAYETRTYPSAFYFLADVPVVYSPDNLMPPF